MKLGECRTCAEDDETLTYSRLEPFDTVYLSDTWYFKLKEVGGWSRTYLKTLSNPAICLIEDTLIVLPNQPNDELCLSFVISYNFDISTNQQVYNKSTKMKLKQKESKRMNFQTAIKGTNGTKIFNFLAVPTFNMWCEVPQ